MGGGSWGGIWSVRIQLGGGGDGARDGLSEGILREDVLEEGRHCGCCGEMGVVDEE